MRRIDYIHDLKPWPLMTWDRDAVLGPLGVIRHRQGKLIARMEAIGLPLRAEAALQGLTEEIITSSEIEGEVLDRGQVRSSIARRIGMDIGGLARADRHVDGVVDMMLDATRKHAQPLTAARLFRWHSWLFPTGRSGAHAITVGAWRPTGSGPMQIVSGPVGREKVHYEAPAARRVPREMTRFLRWFNADNGMDDMLKGAVAHLWFVTIHPFDDGNGRIGRAITELMLARSDRSEQRFYSMSSEIQRARRSYYNILETTQKGDLDTTAWLAWFLACLGRALDNADHITGDVLKKSRFWQAQAHARLNERQRKVIARLLSGFDGKLTSSKWATLAKCSQDTAGRDIDDLVQKGILNKDAAGGRSTSYSLATLSD